MKERVIGSLFLILIVLIISFNAFKAKGLDNIKKYQDEIKQEEVKKEERFFYDETSKISDSQKSYPRGESNWTQTQKLDSKTPANANRGN